MLVMVARSVPSSRASSRRRVSQASIAALVRPCSTPFPCVRRSLRPLNRAYSFSSTPQNTEYAYFFFYSLVRTSYIKRLAARSPAGSSPARLSTIAELALGAIAGALAQIFTIPVAVIATRQQIGAPKGKGKAGEAHDESFFGVAREIVREEGVTGLWLGLKPGLVLTANPAITYGVFERIKGAVLLAREKVGDASTSLGPGLSFALGATSKSLATVVRWPLESLRFCNVCAR
jgi:adenine nucleotide transporter 17